MILLALLLGLWAQGAVADEEDTPFQPLHPGLDWAEIAAPKKSLYGDSLIRIARIDPKLYEFRLKSAGHPGEGKLLTLKAWAGKYGFHAVINASMYAKDHLTAVSLMRQKGYVNNPRRSKDKTILAFNRKKPGKGAPVRLIDTECDDFGKVSDGYFTLIQSIRMLSCKGKNVWAPSPKIWSQAAIGIDAAGRTLFIHSASPWSTHDFIEHLRALPLDLKQAMYVEGGGPAQMYVRAGKVEHELVGAYSSTGQNGNVTPLPLPNVIGVLPRPPDKKPGHDPKP